MNDGNLISGDAARDGTQNVLRFVKSTNGGQSWQYLGEVYRRELATHGINNAFPLLPSDRILCVYRNHDLHWF